MPMGRKQKKWMSLYMALVLTVTVGATTAFAAGDPLSVINNLSTFIFSLIRAIGLILLGFGVVQVGLSLKSHDPSQRANGFLTLAGGVIITFAKDALTAIAYGLLVLFFAAGIIKTCGSFTDLKKPEHVLKAFIRFALAQGAITYGMELMQALFSIVQGIVTTVMSGSSMAGSVTELPTEIVDKIESVGMLESIPLWIVTLLGSLLITVLSFVMILTVYGRMFKIYMYTAIAPIPISSFAGEPTQSIGKNFIRSYIGVCLEGAIIALACIIFSAYAASPPAVGDTELSAVTIVWNYVGELVFNLLVLVGAIKASDRIVREMMGLGG